MEKLKLQSITMEKALATLHEALDSYNTLVKQGDATYVIQRLCEDAIIQRFEYNFDLFWKLLKLYLALTYDLTEAQGPRKVFELIVLQKVCTEEQGCVLLDMLEARNDTSHRYDFEISRSIFSLIEEYYALMVVISKKIAPE